MLIDRKYSMEQINALFLFINFIVTLPKPMEIDFTSEVKIILELKYNTMRKLAQVNVDFIDSVYKDSYGETLTERSQRDKEEGIKVGKEEGKQEIAIKLLKKGSFTTKEIAELTDLPLETITALQAKLKAE